MIEKVLVADDEPLLRDFIAEVLKRKGIDVVKVSDGAAAIAKLEEGPYDLVISDLKMPGKDGMDVLKAAKKLYPQMPVILATAYASIETAVDAMKLGALNFVLKPFSPEAIEINLEKAEEYVRRTTENKFLRDELPIANCPALVTNSPSMRKISQDLEKISKSQASVFITGESGTGKEVIAAAIHRLSLRSSQSFIKVNCAAIPEALVESEFFGHERGAFTGALNRKIGRFEMADKGTLLLDEVTEIPLALQAKLLRAIQEMEFERVGGSRSVSVDVRILATSNRLMTEAIESKVFREDLYYRLNVVPIHLPALRHRPEDILPLAEHFLNRFCIENHKPRKIITPRAAQKLMAYHWPGNIRELGNIIERTVVLDFDAQIDSEHLYLDSVAPVVPQKTVGTRMTLHALEKQLILETFDAEGQNRTKTALSLGISVRTLRNKLHEYGLMGEE
jgi:two-component system response regulator AtoC